jgi:hypothetical protein
MLRLICAVPFTRLVALSGSIAHLNLDPAGDLDLFVITRGRRVWTVMLTLLVLAKTLRQRRIVCANFVLADSHLTLEQQDLFTANQVLHLKPLIGAPLYTAFVAANPFVSAWYPNLRECAQPLPIGNLDSRSLRVVKRVLEVLLWAPAPLVEIACRRLYAWHLQRRSGSWRSPDQVRLQSDYLKLHTQSHRHTVLDRFDAAMGEALDRARAETAPRVAGARRR